MKIEKVNDHQIRCTLTREDLASRRIKMSELAYGSEKAKDLFRDMMEKANDEYGFEVDNIPLMIEAIPVSGECIVLVITKVEDPEELDTRFSKFAPGISDDSEEGSSDSDSEEDSLDDVINIADLFKKFKKAATEKSGKDEVASIFDGMAFSFDSITALASVCKSASSFFSGKSSVYVDRDDSYLLTINRAKMDVTDFVRACNLFSEYGSALRGKSISESFLKEHCDLLIAESAIETLAEIG